MMDGLLHHPIMKRGAITRLEGLVEANINWLQDAGTPPWNMHHFAP
jgi:hypothetical protein